MYVTIEMYILMCTSRADPEAGLLHFHQRSAERCHEGHTEWPTTQIPYRPPELLATQLRHCV